MPSKATGIFELTSCLQSRTVKGLAIFAYGVLFHLFITFFTSPTVITSEKTYSLTDSAAVAPTKSPVSTSSTGTSLFTPIVYPYHPPSHIKHAVVVMIQLPPRDETQIARLLGNLDGMGWMRNPNYAV